MIRFRISRLKRSPGLQTRKTSEPEGSQYENLKLLKLSAASRGESVDNQE
jgi:hypothetical protein